jgi:ElaB/YqjD/DUF883 family membrane-anchored ribosome-binding protein
MEKAQKKAQDALDTLDDTRRQAGEVAASMKTAVDQSMREQPLTTLLMAAALGFVIGAIWKS